MRGGGGCRKPVIITNATIITNKTLLQLSGDFCLQDGWQEPPRPRMHRPATTSQTRETSHQFGRPPPHFGGPARSSASYGAQTSQFRPPPSHFGAHPITSPPQLLDPEAPYSPWEEGRFNFEEGGRQATPDGSNDFFDNFPVKVEDQTDPELERAVNDFAHSFESIKQVIKIFRFRLCMGEINSHCSRILISGKSTRTTSHQAMPQTTHQSRIRP